MGATPLSHSELGATLRLTGGRGGTSKGEPLWTVATPFALHDKTVPCVAATKLNHCDRLFVEPPSPLNLGLRGNILQRRHRSTIDAVAHLREDPRHKWIAVGSGSPPFMRFAEHLRGASRLVKAMPARSGKTSTCSVPVW